MNNEVAKALCLEKIMAEEHDHNNNITSVPYWGRLNYITHRKKWPIHSL